MSPGMILRRGVGAVVLLATLGLLLIGISRFAPRSPLVILVVCVLGILTMKLVEYRVRRWARRWEEREAARNRPPGSRR
jgi:peptidoglycan/LPS O-acetylase OafA/YrhL